MISLTHDFRQHPVNPSPVVSPAKTSHVVRTALEGVPSREIYVAKISLVWRSGPSSFFGVTMELPPTPLFLFQTTIQHLFFFFFNFSVCSLSFLKNKANNRNSPLARGQPPKGWSQETNGCTRGGQGQKAEHSGPVFMSSPDPAGQRVPLGGGATPPGLNDTLRPFRTWDETCL